MENEVTNLSIQEECINSIEKLGLQIEGLTIQKELIAAVLRLSQLNPDETQLNEMSEQLPGLAKIVEEYKHTRAWVSGKQWGKAKIASWLRDKEKASRLPENPTTSESSEDL